MFKKDSMRRAGFSALAASMMVMTLVWAAAAQEIDVSKRGPQVGERVPDFSLPDQRGKTWTLQSIMGRKGAMVVFYRSADWCPYCKTQLLELQSQSAKLQKEGLGLAAISYDSQEILAAFSQQHGITFPLLSDVGSATIKRFGILNTVAEEALGPNGKDPDVIAQAKRLWLPHRQRDDRAAAVHPPADGQVSAVGDLGVQAAQRTGANLSESSVKPKSKARPSSHTSELHATGKRIFPLEVDPVSSSV